MTYRESSSHKPSGSKKTNRISARVRDLAEAGASGGALSPVEIREVCEALRAQSRRVPTHFHSGFSA